jgi:hypothetical protein
MTYKALIHYDSPCAHAHPRRACSEIMNLIGIPCLLWDTTNPNNTKPFYDIMDENPDLQLLWLQSYNLTQGMVRAIAERPYLKIAIRAADSSPLIDSMDKNKYKIIWASDQQFKLISQIRDIIGNDNLLLFNHYPDKYFPLTHENWIKEGYNVKQNLLGVDLSLYSNPVPREVYHCDATFIGGCIEYKRRRLLPWLGKLDECDDIRLRIYSSHRWSLQSHVGAIPMTENKNALSSSKILLNVSEQHSVDIGADIIERVYYSAFLGFLISDYVDGINDIFGYDTIVMAKTPDDMREMVQHYLRYPDERLPFMKRARKKVLENHTYFHRVSDMFKNLGMQGESDKTMVIYDMVRNKL